MVEKGSNFFSRGASPPGPPIFSPFYGVFGTFSNGPPQKKVPGKRFFSNFLKKIVATEPIFLLIFLFFLFFLFLFFWSKSAQKLRYRMFFLMKSGFLNCWAKDKNIFQTSLFTKTIFFCTDRKLSVHKKKEINDKYDGFRQFLQKY